MVNHKHAEGGASRPGRKRTAKAEATQASEQSAKSAADESESQPLAETQTKPPTRKTSAKKASAPAAHEEKNTPVRKAPTRKPSVKKTAAPPPAEEAILSSPKRKTAVKPATPRTRASKPATPAKPMTTRGAKTTKSTPATLENIGTMSDPEAMLPPVPPAIPQPNNPANGIEAHLNAGGPTRVVLMIRDPEWLYAYWEISTADREAHAIGQPQGAPPLLLRVFDLGTSHEPIEAAGFFDLTVLPEASGWYIHIPQGGGQWRVGLGYLSYEGDFVTVAQSNNVVTPSPIQAGWTEQVWGPVSEEEALAPREAFLEEEEDIFSQGVITAPSRLVRRATRLMAYLRGGASEQVLRPGASEQLPLRPGASEQFLRPGASEQQFLRPGASEQFAIPGSAQMGRPVIEVPGKTFWLQVNTELIVYGATEPDAKVTVQGRPIQLRPDGTFTLRFALPDGEQVIPVHAVNADGDMERTITPIVTRRTV